MMKEFLNLTFTRSMLSRFRAAKRDEESGPKQKYPIV